MARYPELRERFQWFLESRPEICAAIHDPAKPGVAGRRLGSVQESPAVNGCSRGLKAATAEARTLQALAFRRIWSTLLDYRDWISYIYVPLLIPICILLPYVLVKSYQHSQRVSHLVESLAHWSYK